MSAPGPSMHCAIDYSGEVSKGSKCVEYLDQKQLKEERIGFGLEF